MSGPRQLTAEQEHAVERRSEPLLLSAAAGSGKTMVLVERFVRAVREDGLKPSQILAITFTERAAGELRGRVRAGLLELGEREAARDTEAAFVGTFHGFCSRILRAHAPAAALDPDFAILEEGASTRLRERALRGALAELQQGGREQALDLLAAYGVDRAGRMVLAAHAQLRSRGMRRPRLPLRDPALEADATDAEAMAACVLLDELLVLFSDAYEELKRRRGAVDFDDLELIAGELLASSPAVRESWSGRFELLMVDEFQDTNARQLAILTALDRGNLFTVGDELQSIYGFRHADVELFRARRAELAERGASIAITSNFRSAPQVLGVVNALFAERFDGFTALVAGAPAPPPRGPAVELLVTAKKGWDEDPELRARLADGLPHTAAWRHAEARLLARRLAGLVDSGEVHPGQVAVLLRAGGDLDVYELALQQAGLRTLAAAGAFWEHRQVGDLLEYLRVIANPGDEAALYGVLATPLVGLSSDSLALLARRARAGPGLWRAALAAGDEPTLEPQQGRALAAFCEWVLAERAGAQLRSLSELIERVVQSSGYREHVLAQEWGERRLANVHKLLRVARRYEAAEGRDLRGFLDHVELLARGSGEAHAPVGGDEPDAVRLMSIHASKGLEFPVVCVADLGRSPNNRAPDLLVDGGRIGLALARLDGEKAAQALDYAELLQERAGREAAEEDRILYVAMTRARERLILSGGAPLERWPSLGASAGTISWVGPALAPDLPETAERAGPGPHAVPVQGAGELQLTVSTPGCAAELLPPAIARAGPAPAAAPAVALGVDRPAPAAAAAPEIASLSYTALSELERCGYRYYLERVLRLPAAPAGGGDDAGLAARLRGTLIHALMEEVDFTRPAAPSPERVREAAEGLSMRTSAAEREEVASMIAAAAAAPPASRLAAAGATRREHPFAFALGPDEPLVTGYIDLLVDEGDGRMLIVDYKSDRVAAGEDLERLTAAGYGAQRLLYAVAVLRTGAQRVDVAHWYLRRPEQWALASYAASELPALEREIARRVAGARAGRFAVAARPHRSLCQDCPGLGGMCSWDRETALAAQE